MSTFSFACNAVLPIILLIFIGYELRVHNFFDDTFLKYGNKFVFHVALPALLFFNVYSIEGLGKIKWSLVLFSCFIILVLFVCGIILVSFFVPETQRKGVILQCVFRSNFAIIGIPLTKSLGGDASVAIASVLSAFSIPLFNILAVIALTVYHEEEDGKAFEVTDIIRKISRNPLILGVLCGLICLFVRSFIPYDSENERYVFTIKDNLPFLYETIKDLGTIASPLALVVLGGKFHISVVKPLFRYIAMGTIWRVLIAPAFALCAAVYCSHSVHFLNFTGNDYPALIALFGTPVAVSSAIMAGEMGADEELAGQLVVWTSICSIFTIFLIVVITKTIGLI